MEKKCIWWNKSGAIEKCGNHQYFPSCLLSVTRRKTGFCFLEFFVCFTIWCWSHRSEKMMAPMEDQHENPWHISHQCKFLQTFSPILWKLLGVKLHKGRSCDYTGWDITETGLKACSWHHKGWHEEASVKVVGERWKDWAEDVLAYLCLKSCEWKWCHGWCLVGKNKCRCPHGTTWYLGLYNLLTWINMQHQEDS